MKPVLFMVYVSLAAFASAQSSFVNYETAHVSPLALSPDGSVLAACNTPDNRVELFSLVDGIPVHVRSVPVGLDPVSVRFRTNGELWCVNQISDSVSVIDLASDRIIASLRTQDEPADVVFAGTPVRAFVSCSQANSVLVFDPVNLAAPVDEILLEENAPRVMATSPDRQTVYVAFFESGNATMVDGGAEDRALWPWSSEGMDSSKINFYVGMNPPAQYEVVNEDVLPVLPENPDAYPWPRSSLIMTVGDGHDWQDNFVVPFANVIKGEDAAVSGRIPGWDRTDHGIAVISANTLSVRYIRNLMTQNMCMGVNPVDGKVAVSGLRSHNYVRFEPNVQGSFTDHNIFFYDPIHDRTENSQGERFHVVNWHIARFDHAVPPALRERSIGDPRGIAWRADGQLLYMTGMGSNNIAILNGEGFRLGGPNGPFTIEVGEGPTGIVSGAALNRFYVLNRFDASISVVDTDAGIEIARTSFFDPTPEIIVRGRRHFYDTHATSGTGMVSCATCHVDGKTDKFGWNLGDPGGEFLPVHAEANPGGGIQGIADDLESWHPMKGDMVTQTLQDIIGKEPFHWRGDRRAIEEFNGAFVTLLGSDRELTEEEMADFKGFLATITFPPNPLRNLDNTLPADMPLPGLLTAGTFGPAREPLPNGNALRGLELFRTALPREGLQIRCVECHTLPTGTGTNYFLNGGDGWELLPPGPNEEAHHALVSITGASGKTFKVPHLRSVREKIGFDLQAPFSRRGFGFMHDGTVDTLPRLLSAGHFAVSQSDQDVADLAAFLLAFTGSDFPEGGDPNDPPGTPSQDSHAAVGYQITVAGDAKQSSDVAEFLELADNDRINATVRWVEEDFVRGAVYDGAAFQTDRAAQTLTLADLSEAAESLTFTMVYAGTETRIALDRDEDGLFDNDEQRELGNANPFNYTTADGSGDDGETAGDGVLDGENDFDGDVLTNADEFARGSDPTSADTDGDGLDDGVEVNDNGTDPLDGDSDGDTLNDGDEVNEHDTNPNAADSDGDGLDDGVEFNTSNSDPNERDSDDDGVEDGAEVEIHGSDPNDTDSDNDALDDGWEVDNGLDPASGAGNDGTNGDPDDDGLSNAEELEGGTDPQVAEQTEDSDEGCGAGSSRDASDRGADVLLLIAIAAVLFCRRAGGRDDSSRP